MLRSKEWYLEKYDEDWAEIVREEDERLLKQARTLEELAQSVDKSPKECWARHEINNQ